MIMNLTDYEETLEYTNKLLYMFMKDGVTWYPVISEDGVCRYNNPINTAAYGLMFHKSKDWLIAVQEKISNYYNNKGFETYWTFSEIEGKGTIDYCFQFHVRKDGITDQISHKHSNSWMEGARQVMLEAVRTIITKYN